MKHCIVDLRTAPEHAQKCIAALGVTYEVAVPQSIGDCWWFFNCRNLPEVFPEWLRLHDFKQETLDQYAPGLGKEKPRT